MTTTYTCKSCHYVTVVTSPKPTTAGPILCGKCGASGTDQFAKQEKAA